jgi:hypothetical protein
MRHRRGIASGATPLHCTLLFEKRSEVAKVKAFFHL